MESDTQKARKLWALTQTMKESLQLPTIKTFCKQGDSEVRQSPQSTQARQRI